MSHIITLVFLVERLDPAALVSGDGHAPARRGVEEADPVAGDLAAVGEADQVEAKLVGALELHLSGGEHQVRCARRWAGGDGDGLLREFVTEG